LSQMTSDLLKVGDDPNASPRAHLQSLEALLIRHSASPYFRTQPRCRLGMKQKVAVPRSTHSGAGGAVGDWIGSTALCRTHSWLAAQAGWLRMRLRRERSWG
jgi:hypothetical protein